ncbi:MAG: hypothetical protein CVT61_02420 [Actinobacteria bacterium HGW-Actinobacteria-11]|nr:MAG: hypothetical protein CVT61_02420 [Actinobacteria bacterium HGW-Actinobacteria-11]
MSTSHLSRAMMRCRAGGIDAAPDSGNAEFASRVSSRRAAAASAGTTASTAVEMVETGMVGSAVAR